MDGGQVQIEKGELAVVTFSTKLWFRTNLRVHSFGTILVIPILV